MPLPDGFMGSVNHMANPLHSSVHPPVEDVALIGPAARLQPRVGPWASTTYGKVVAQETDILRLRVQLLLARTASLWGALPSLTRNT